MDILMHRFIHFIWLLCLRATFGNHCTNDNIDQCWAPVDHYLIFQGHDPDHSMFAYFDLSEAELRGYCRIYQGQTSPCLADIVRHCPYETKKDFEGLEDSEDFFCNEGLEDYIKHKDCIGSSTVQTQIDRCDSQLNQELDYIDSLYLTYSQTTARTCKAFYNSIVCDKEAAEKHCGEEAGEWMETYERKLYGPPLEHYGCDLDIYDSNDLDIDDSHDLDVYYSNDNSSNSNDNGHSKTATIAGAVVGALVILIIISLVGRCCASNRQPSSSSNRPGEPSVTVAYVHQPGSEATAPPPFYPDKTDQPPPYQEKSLPSIV